MASNQLFWHVLDDNWNQFRSDFDDFDLCFSGYVPVFNVGLAQQDQGETLTLSPLALHVLDKILDYFGPCFD